jgi:signal peptidase I
MRKLTWKRVWNFIWKEDSLASWVVNIILAVILIKFVIYPGIGWALGTQLPVVAVISESMEHKTDKICEAINTQDPKHYGECIKYSDTYSEICGAKFTERTSLDLDTYWKTCGGWYTNHSITLEQFATFPMKNGFNKGDIIILKGAAYDKINIGDVIVFQSGVNYPVIHRVIDKNDVIQTKGDHNRAQIESTRLNEKYITKEQIIGKAWIRIPWLGYIKIWAVDLVQCATLQGCSFN